MKKLFVFICLLSCILSSCREDCQQPMLGIGFNNFDSVSLSVIKVSKYKKGSNYSQILDAAIYSNAYKFDTMHQPHDTIYIGYFGVQADKDYLIELPLAGKSYKLSNIHYSNDTQPDYGWIKFVCYDRTYYDLNGADSSVPAPPNSEDGMGQGADIIITP